MDGGSATRHLAMIWLLLFLFCGRGAPALTQTVPRAETKVGHAGRGPLLSRGRLVECASLVPTEEGMPDRIEVRENSKSAGPAYTVYFVAGWPASPTVLTEYPGFSPSPPQILFAGSNLILEWVAGDRPVIQAFRLVKGGAKLVFNEGARGGFEYWHEVILQNDAALGADGNYHATTTKLWGWDGERYKLLATVPYGQRLRELARLEAESKIR
jgi:hypothetical protein